jgi:hypothetical protein
MAVITQRQRPLQIVGQRLECAEMRDPALVAERAEAHRRRPAVVAEAQDVLRKLSRRDRIVKGVAKREDRLFGDIGGGLRKRHHAAIGGSAQRG